MPVTWNRGPWATRSAPYQSLQSASPASAPVGSPYGSLTDAGPAGNPPDRGPETAAEREFGGYSRSIAEREGQMAALGYDARVGAANMRGAYGAMQSLALGPFAPVAFALAIRNLMNVNEDLQREGARRSFGAVENLGIPGRKPGEPGYAEDTTYDPTETPTDLTTGFGRTGEPTDLSGATGRSGELGDTNAGPGGPGGQADSPGPGDSPGDSGYMRQGGVINAKRPFHAVFGERGTGGETGIFIPRTMQRPGMQGRERQVRRGLQGAYASLTGGRR